VCACRSKRWWWVWWKSNDWRRRIQLFSPSIILLESRVSEHVHASSCVWDYQCERMMPWFKLECHKASHRLRSPQWLIMASLFKPMNKKNIHLQYSYSNYILNCIYTGSLQITGNTGNTWICSVNKSSVVAKYPAYGIGANFCCCCCSVKY